MAAIRTVEQLVDALDEDLAWRKREVSTWSALLLHAKDHQKDVLLRGAWALLYAHWEGYIKSACVAYLQYVSQLGLKVDELSDSLVAVAMRPSIASAVENNHGSAHTQLVAAIRAGQLKANLPYESATIKTFANLKFEIFEEILWSINLDPAPHQQIRDDVDLLLLKNRNDIAHGKYLTLDSDSWEKLRVKVVQVLDDVRTQLENAALTAGYRRAALNP